jgi:uncharacterized repeat protein (TIGR03803 family)
VLDLFNSHRNGSVYGSFPVGGLARDMAGNIYGTTSEGGTGFRGVVFKLDPTGQVTVVHNFTGPDGDSPMAGLIADSAGNVYGTTSRGGSVGGGVVFKLDPASTTIRCCTTSRAPMAPFRSGV